MSEDQSKKNQKQSSALKAHKQSVKANKRNSVIRSMIVTYTKKFLEAVESKDHKKSTRAFAKIQSVLFRSAKKNVIKFNKAVRITSRLNKKMKVLESALSD